jgi:HEAT repeat protein
VARWAEGEPQAPRVLQHLLFDEDELVAWRAVEALGTVAYGGGRADLEPARELVRRVLWLMNDESGGLLWKGPQVIGAVLARVPALRAELVSVLASFLEEVPFRVGTRWALWRLSLAAPEAAREAGAALASSLADPDPAVRGHAALALRGIGHGVHGLERDGAAFVAFDPRTGELRETTVARAAAAGEP